MPSLWLPGVILNWGLSNNMGIVRRVFSTALCLLLLLTLILPAAAAEEDKTQQIVRDLIAYYFHYRDKAQAEIDNQLQTLSDLDPRKGEVWREVMEKWAWINEEMTVYTGQLPEGLPADDSLCIVVLGYGLKEDGSMKQELIHRLETALASAEAYPESYVLCTGGETASVPGISEAGQMGSWLLAKGLPHNRLILEEDSLSTTENARNSCRILRRDYPQVRSLAIVTSDYHIRWGTACFSAETILGAEEGKEKLEIVGNAGCVTDSPNQDTMFSQAWGVSIIADVPFDSSYVPVLYMSEDPPAAEPMPAAQPVSEPVQTETAQKEPVAMVLLGLAAVLVILFIPKKRRTSGSK